MSIHQRLAEWSAWGWPLLVNHLWQATLFALLAFLVARLLNRSPARARYIVWLVASAKFAIPSVLVVFLSNLVGVEIHPLFDSTTEAPQSVAVISQVTAPIVQFTGPVEMVREASRDHNELYCALTSAWFAGCAALLFMWGRRRLQFIRAMKQGRVMNRGREAEAVNRARMRRGIKRSIRLVITPKLIEPGVWGIWRPVVVLPESIADHLTTAELDAVMLHEMIHVARWDNLINSAHMFFCCLLWFHPLVWIIDRKLLAESERVCDEKVLELGGSSKVYASSLLKVLRFCMGCKVAGISYATGSNLRRRIEKIMAGNLEIRLATSHRILVAGILAAAAIFSVAAGMLSRTSIAAQSKRGSTIRQGGVAGGVPGGVAGGVVGGVPGGVEGGIDGGPSGFFAWLDGSPRWHVTPSKIKELYERAEMSADTVINFANDDESPLAITDARVKAIKVDNDQLSPSSAAVPGDAYFIRPSFTVVNKSKQRVTGFWVSVTNTESGRRAFYLGNRIEIEPQGSYSFTELWRGVPGNIVLPGSPQSIVIKVLGVEFEDGDVWGDAPPPTISKDMMEKLEQAPEVNAQFKNREGSPLTISSLKVKALASGRPTDAGDEEKAHPANLIKAILTAVNNSSKRITAIKLQLSSAESNTVWITDRLGLRIDPFSTYTFGKSNREFMYYPRDVGSPELLIAEIIGVKFEDGSTWGSPPEPPFQPSPPRPSSAPEEPGPPPGAPRYSAPGSSRPGFSAPTGTGPVGQPGVPAGPAPRPPAGPRPPQDGDGVEPPVILSRVLPEYTEQARRNNTEGTVDVRALVDKRGAVKSVKIVKGLPDGLSGSAENAVRKLRFKPAMKDGEPVEFWVPLAIEFYNK